MRNTYVVLLLLLPLLTEAQRNMQPGYIITNEGQKQAGFLNHREWDRTPVSVEFSTTKDEKALKKLGVADISYFEITGAEKYERHTCNISLTKTNLNELSIGPDSAQTRSLIFLKVLETGKVNLYQYRDDLKRRYYIKTATDSEPRELLNTLYYDAEKGSDLVQLREYRDQLRIEAERYSDNNTVKKKIQDAAYQDGDIAKSVRLINSGGVTDKAADGGLKKSWFFAGAGATYSSYMIIGDRRPYPSDGYSFSGSVSPLFFTGINLYMNPRIGRLLLKADLSVFFNSHKASAPGPVTSYPYTYNYTYSMKYSVATLYLGATYNFVKTTKLEAYLSAGPAIFVAGSSETKEHEVRVSTINPADRGERDIDPLKIQNLWFGQNLRTGLLLNRKIDVSLSFNGQKSKLMTYTYFGDKATYTQLRVGYMFGGNK